MFSFLFLLFSTGKCNANVQPKLSPPNAEVIHSVGERHIVSCEANNTAVKWIDPRGKEVAIDHGRVHFEKRTGNVSILMFMPINLSDNGTWTCKAEKSNNRVSFNMVVYSK